MDLPQTSTAAACPVPPIPEAGLAEVLEPLRGQGHLWESLASIHGTTDRHWTARDIRRRAYRILLAQLLPALEKWPLRDRDWIEALPAESIHNRATTSAPTSGTSWPDTRRLGWPPRVFSGRVRERIADTLLVTSLRWTLDELAAIRIEAVAVEPSVDQTVRRQLAVALGLLQQEPLRSSSGVMPSRSDVECLRAEGRPWNAVAPVADALQHPQRGSLAGLARRLIMPSEDLRWRLFHLGVFGEMLLALGRCGCTCRSLRPLSGSSTGPAYRVQDKIGRMWDLWFEAAGAWGHYRRESPYVRAAAGLLGGNRALGADILLIRPNRAALIVECKYSADPGVVGRDGYEQALAYAVEITTELAKHATSVVVGPEGVVLVRLIEDTFVQTTVGKVGIIPSSILGEVVSIVLEAEG